MNPHAAQLAEEVMRRCDRLACFSEEPDRLTRRYLCEPMHDVHRALEEWMRDARLVPRIDHAGNCIGRLRSADAEKVLLLGSHLDTVPGGGRYDGVLGVLIALAVAQRLADTRLPFHVDVLGLSEEEGVRYKMPYLGSAALAGTFRGEWLDRCDERGVALRDAIAHFHLDPDRIGEGAYQPHEVVAYVEPHLEQGPVLEQRGAPVGVVSGIAGQSRLRLAFLGKAGHAGTTPMTGRRDALLAASKFIQLARDVGGREEGLRTTVGNLHVSPNAPNVIPDRVELSLDIRHLNDATRRRAIDDLLEAGRRCASEEGCQQALLEESSQDAVSMNDDLRRALQEALTRCGCEPVMLESGAGHDAVVMAQAFPVAMLFVRHPGGVSHHPDERVHTEDVAVAIEVLTNYVLHLAQPGAPQPQRQPSGTA